MGSDSVRGEFEVRHFRTATGSRLVYRDTGTFDISEGGSRIRWHRPSDSERPWNPAQFLEAARIDIIGRVMAAAMHNQGIYCLHGSAVRIAGKAVGFLAPKFYGKSTLAFALVSAGAGLITDDTLPVEIGTPCYARPGVHSVRMWEDSIHQLQSGAGSFELGAFGKFKSSALAEDRLVYDRSPLDTLYLLLPVQGGAEAIQYAPTEPTAAAIALVQHAKIGPLLRDSEAGRMLEWATALSQAVRVSFLGIARDFSSLPAVVDHLMRMHEA